MTPTIYFLTSLVIFSVSIALPLKEFNGINRENVHLLPIAKPDLIRISIRGFNGDEDDQQVFPHAKQIPVISDIERIKRIAEILVKVGDIIGSLPELPKPAGGNENRSKKENRKESNGG